MSAPNWGGEVLPALHGGKQGASDEKLFIGQMLQPSLIIDGETGKPNN